MARRSTPEGPLRRSGRWAGLVEGDAVAVDLPKERGSRFVFVAHVTHAHTGEEWVEVRGGSRGRERLRSFRPETIIPAPAYRRSPVGRAPFTDAPRLPFGGP